MASATDPLGILTADLGLAAGVRGARGAPPGRAGRAPPAPQQWDADAVRAKFIADIAAKLGPAHSAADAELRQQLADNAALGPRANIADVAEAAGMGAVQGASLHFSDEVLAALRSLVGSESYDEALASHRDYLQGLEERNPVAYTVGDVAGTMAAPLPGGHAIASLPLRYGLKTEISGIGGATGNLGERAKAAAPKALLSSILGPLTHRYIDPILAKAAYKLGDPWLAH